ncbi:hypothetical protein BGZ80_009234 [Entomortierella chlamydospora]|uniref:RNI-like protein n=1 Tax=Entomortierella chlamydospora TaxID=101097 RepID=A0A9P6MWM9_9FUNG|nr:hypothetical protein BGZ80_009234 [Entomortierella chlamydospora]
MPINFALDFFKAHPTLQDISFEFDTITPELIATLDKSHLPALKPFGLIGGDDIKDDASVQQLIHACARLESLEISTEHFMDYREEPNVDLYQERKTIMENMPTTRLRYLYIDLHCASQEAVTLFPLLRKSPLLQDLHINFCLGNDMSNSIATILRDEGYCPELKTLSIIQDEITDSKLAELVNACTGHGSSLTTTTPDKVHRILKSLSIASKNYGPLTINSIIQNCVQNLVALDIRECEYVHLSNFIALVSNLPGLQTLFVGNIYFVSRVQGVTNSLVNALETPWVCRGLESLRFNLCWINAKDDSNVEDDSNPEDDGNADDDSDTEDDGNTDCGSTGRSDTNDMADLANFRSRCLGCFWDRVGELKNLRYLSYGGDDIPLITSTENEVSYLDRLRGS